MARKRAPAGTPASQQDNRTIPRAVLVRMNDDGLVALGHLAVDQHLTLQALGIEAFNDLLRKYGCKAVIQNPRLKTRRRRSTPR
jgi:hypothetical protein